MNCVPGIKLRRTDTTLDLSSWEPRSDTSKSSRTLLFFSKSTSTSKLSSIARLKTPKLTSSTRQPASRQTTLFWPPNHLICCLMFIGPWHWRYFVSIPAGGHVLHFSVFRHQTRKYPKTIAFISTYNKCSNSSSRGDLKKLLENRSVMHHHFFQSIPPVT